jgi:hypothetical protein
LHITRLASASVNKQPNTEIYPQRTFSFACDLWHNYRITKAYYRERAAQHVLLTHVLTFINDADIFFNS